MDRRPYWPEYLAHHSHPTNRLLHACGWTTLLLAISASVWSMSLLPLPFGVAAAYALAWTGHFCFERDVPETLRRPIVANLASLRLFLLIVSGRIGRELARHGVDRARR